MRSFEYYLILFFSGILFLFRLVVVITTVLGVKFSVVSLNVPFELVLLLLMLISIVLMVKIKLTGSIIFLVSSLCYYVPDLINSLENLSEVTSTIEGNIQLIATVIGILIPLFAFFIMLMAKKQQVRPVDKKTDFFYKGNQYDREYDERADKNNYRIY